MKNIGVFINYSNINEKVFNNIYTIANELGNIIINKCFIDIKNNNLLKINSNEVEKIYCEKNSYENFLDMKIVDTIYETVYHINTVDTYVLCFTNFDIKPLYHRLKLYGHNLIVINFQEEINKIDLNIDTFAINLEKNIKEEIPDKLNIKDIFSEKKKFYNINTLQKKSKSLKIKELEKLKFIKIIKKNEKRIVYDLSAINSNKYQLLIEQINDIFFHYGNSELQLSVLKDKLISMTQSFNQKNYGFNNFSDFILNIYEGQFEIVKVNSTSFIKMNNCNNLVEK